MQFGVLGTFRVSDGEGEIEVPGAKERTLLAHLVADVGRTVSVDALTETLWGDEPPRAPAKALQTYVLRIRNVLEPDRGTTPRLVVRDDGGYRLDAPPEAVDAFRFARLADQGRHALDGGHHAEAEQTLRDALALWRGPAYSGFQATDFGASESRRLEEVRVAAEEDLWSARLAQGDGRDVVPAVERLLEQHPYRERLWSVLLRALYRSGRQADALAAYDRVRARLADDLGVDPGPELRALHARVLAQDPTLGGSAPPPAASTGGPLPPDAVREVVALHAAEDDVDAATDAVLAGGPADEREVHRRASAWVRRTAGARAHLGSASLARSAAEVAATRREVAEQVFAVEQQGHAEVSSSVAPWPGLPAYDVTDAARFAGRERLVAELVARVATSGLVAVVGGSGSGKSSVVRAGLLAALADGRLPGSDQWPVVLLRPGSHPMRELARRAVGASHRASTGDLLAQLAVPGSPTRTLVVVDQLEEVFTLCRDEGERAAFLDTLLELSGQGPDVATVLLVVRADFVARLADHAGLAAALVESTVLVGVPGEAEVRRMVQLPARWAGLDYDLGLDEAIVADAGAEPGLLPLLSSSLHQLWERRSGRRLTYAAYLATGGLAGAIAHVAEELYAGLDEAGRSDARVLFLRLAGSGAGPDVSRRRLPLRELDDLQGDLRTVADVFVAARLLTADDATLEVAHEALFREWPRLAGWLAEGRAERETLGRLAAAAAEWEAAGRDHTLLWRGTRLASGLDTARARPDEVTRTELEFLDEGAATLDTERRDAEARADQAARHNRRLRTVLAGLAVVLTLAVVAGLLALAARQDAVSAERRQAQAARSADAKRLAAQSLVEGKLDLALLEAVEAVRSETSPETQGALLTLLARVPALVRQTRSAQFLRGARTDDGRTVFLSEYEPRLWAFDAVTGDVRWQVEVPGGGAVWTLDAGRAGLLGEVDTEEGGLVVLWDPLTGDERWRVTTEDVENLLGPGADPWPRDAVWTDRDRAVFLTSTHLVLLDARGRLLRGVPLSQRLPAPPSLLRVWPDGRVSFESPLDVGHVVDPSTGRVRDLPHAVDAVSPDGRLVVTADRSDPDQVRLRLREARTFDPVGAEMVVSSYDGGLDWSPDGRTFVLGAGETLQVRDRRGRLRQEYAGAHDGAIMVALRGAEGRWWTGGRDGLASLWNGSEDDGVIRSRRLDGSVTFGATSADGATGIGIRSYQDRLNQAHLVHADAARVVDRPLPLPERCECQVQAVTVAADGSVLAGVLQEWTGSGFADDRGRLALWSPAGELLGETRLPWAPHGVALTPDGRRAVVNGSAGFAVVDVGSGDVVVGPVADAGRPRGSGGEAQVSPDGRRAVLLRDRVLVVDVASGDVLAQRRLGRSQADTPMTAAWAADGESMSVSTFDARLLFLDADSLDSWAPTRQAAAGLVADQVASPDGRLLATLGSDGDLRLWDASTAAPLGLPLTEENTPGLLSWDADSRWLRVLHEAGTPGGDGRMRMVDTDPDAWVAQACAIAGRELTADEWAVVRPGTERRPTCG